MSPVPDTEQPILRGCRDLDEHVRGRLIDLTNQAHDRFGDQLLAVVLGGSLARGQGITLRRRDGRTALLSDIDVYVVVTPTVSMDERAEFLGSAIAVLGMDDRMISPPDLAVVDYGYFAQSGHRLVHAQLRNGCRFLWPIAQGPVAALRRQWKLATENAPAPSVADGQRLVLNRCTEWWLVHDADPALAAAHRMKQWIDAPLSWLVSAGRYHPSREEQARRLKSLTWQLPEEVRRRWTEGIEYGALWVKRAQDGPVEEEELLQMACTSAMEEPSSDPVRKWVWPFVRCAWQGKRGGDIGALGDALLEGEPTLEDRVLAARWLRRHALPGRWREARRWAPLSPRALRPWWRHGHEGSGIERLWVACTLAYAGLEGGAAVLEGLARSPVIDDPHDWAQWWMEWFLGKGRR